VTALPAAPPSRDVLAAICGRRRARVAQLKAARPLAEVERAARAADPPRGFAAALRRATAAGRTGLIAEIKRASPSKGLIREDFDPPALARAYAEGGATCLSVLTEPEDFRGDDAHLAAARAACALPVLRKDFMVDPWQIAESRALGADCVLLILAALDDALAAEMAAAAAGLGMDVLAEVHDAAEMERALRLPDTVLLGVNNRDLKTLSIDLATTERLAATVPPGRVLVGESGIHGPADVARMARAGARCVLVGESLMRQPDVAAAARALLSAEGTA
jgi:indole-3-glycerol phosphate synthase